MNPAESLPAAEYAITKTVNFFRSLDWKPNYIIDSLVNLDVNALLEREAQLKVVSLDLDQTVVRQNTWHIESPHQRAIRRLARAGLHLAIPSNAEPPRVPRVKKFGQDITEITGSRCLALASSEKDRGFKRKPHESMFEAIAEHFGVEANEIVHFGDLAYRDVAGGNRFGCVTVQVAPIHEGEDHFFAGKVMRPTERFVRPSIGLPREFEDFPSELTRITFGRKHAAEYIPGSDMPELGRL